MAWRVRARLGFVVVWFGSLVKKRLGAESPGLAVTAFLVGVRCGWTPFGRHGAARRGQVSSVPGHDCLGASRCGSLGTAGRGTEELGVVRKGRLGYACHFRAAIGRSGRGRAVFAGHVVEWQDLDRPSGLGPSPRDKERQGWTRRGRLGLRGMASFGPEGLGCQGGAVIGTVAHGWARFGLAV